MRALSEQLDDCFAMHLQLAGGAALLTPLLGSDLVTGSFVSLIWINKVAVDCLTRPLVERRTINSLLSYAIVVVLASAAVATVSSVALLVIFGLPVELISVAVTVPVFMSYTTLLRLPLELVVAFNDVTHHTFQVSPRKMARQFEELVKLAPEGEVSLDFEKEIKSKIEALQTIVSPAEAKDALRDIRIAVGETMLPCKLEGSTKEYHRCYGKFLDSLRQLE